MKMSMICHIKALSSMSSSLLEEEDDFTALLIEEVVKESSPCNTSGISEEQLLTFCVFSPHSTKKQRCAVCQTAIQWDLPITEGQKHVEKQPGLDLQYLGKLCSICLPNSPSAAAIWQESLKAHFWQRDKAGEKNAPQIIPKSQGTSSSAYICLTGV